MQTTRTLFGASRLPLTPKRGNKDFYKGTGQSYVPSGGHRTGPPGKHVIGGTAKYRLLDNRVRYFVGPAVETSDLATLKPYVLREPRQPRSSTNAESSTSSSSNSTNPRPAPFSRNTKEWRSLTHDAPYEAVMERERMIMQQRREWWRSQVGLFGRQEVEQTGRSAGENDVEEERRTKELEERAAAV